MKKILAALAFLAIFISGCVTQSTVTDGDRQVLDQSRKGTAIAIEKVTAAAATAGDEVTKAKLSETKETLLIVQSNLDQQLKVHGGPEKPMEFSKQNSDLSKKQSDQEHAGLPWGKILIGVGSAAAGIAGAFFGMPWLSSVFPALTGKIGKALSAVVQATTKARQEAEANGGTLHVKDLLNIHKDEQVRAGVRDLVSDMAKGVEEKFGIEHTIDLVDGDGIAAAVPRPNPVPAPASVSPPS